MEITITEPSVTEARTLPVVSYSSGSALRQPLQLVRDVLTDLWQFRELTWILFSRDLKAQYRQSFLGYAWLFVPVVSTTIVWMFLHSNRVVRIAETPIPYPAYVLIGTLIWGVFVDSVGAPLAAFNAGRTVFTRLKVPPEAFILSSIGRVIFESMIRVVVLVPVFMLLKLTPASTAWLFPAGIACVMLSGMSLGILLLPLGSLYTDVSRLITAALSLAMYLTPVVYPPPADGWAGMIVRWNPMTALVMTTRDWLTLGHSPYLAESLVTTAVGAAGLLAGLIIFRIVLPRLVERMGM